MSLIGSDSRCWAIEADTIFTGSVNDFLLRLQLAPVKAAAAAEDQNIEVHAADASTGSISVGYSALVRRSVVVLNE